MPQFQIISVFPPKTAGKVVARAVVILTQPCYMQAEDYNSETQKSYKQAEGMVSTGFKFNCSVILDSKQRPMIVGSILPPFDMGRQIAHQALQQLQENEAA